MTSKELVFIVLGWVVCLLSDDVHNLELLNAVNFAASHKRMTRDRLVSSNARDLKILGLELFLKGRVERGPGSIVSRWLKLVVELLILLLRLVSPCVSIVLGTPTIGICCCGLLVEHSS